MILAFDPGEVRIGFAMFEYFPERRKANLVAKKILSPSEFFDVLEAAYHLSAPKKDSGYKHIFLYENFRVDSKVRNTMFQWSEVKTSRCIGAIEFAARLCNDSPVVSQEPSILGMGRKWCDLPGAKKKHLDDDLSAYIHGAHFMMKRQMIDTVDDIAKFGQEGIS